MIKRILGGVMALLVVVAIGVGGAYLWKNWQKSKESKTSQTTEVKLPLASDGAKQGGELPGNLGPEAGLDTFLNETSVSAKTTDSRGTAAPAKGTPVPAKGTPVPAKGTPVPAKGTPVAKKPTTEAKAPGEGDFGPEPEGLAGDMGAPATKDTVAPATSKEQRPTRPTTGQPATRPTPRPATREAQPTETQPTGTQPAGTTAIEPILAPTPTPTPATSATPTPTTPAATPTPTTPLPTPAPGNYNVRTIAPIWETQLAAVRGAMKSLGVLLQEQKIGRQELPASRIAVGYFQTKAEAESWAQYNFRPRGIKYYVYPAQGMFSLQLGIYTQQQNIDAAMREFYQRYQGGRLPIREEAVSIAKSVYQLSISQITKSLAEKVWDKLTRLGIQAEISGI